MTVIGPLPISPHCTAPPFSSVLPAEHLQGWEKPLCADRDQKCLSDGCSLLPRMPLPATQGVFWCNREKNQNAAAKGLVQAGAEHLVWSIWSLLLGLCAWDHLEFCPHSPGSAHAKLLPVPQHLAPGGCYHVQKGRRRQNKHSQESHNIAAALPGNRL